MSAPIVEPMDCPFCGEPAILCVQSSHRPAPFVYCAGCLASSHDFETKVEAVTAWNKRATQAADTIEGLLAAFEHISSSYENQDISHLVFRVNAKNIADAAIAKAKGGAA